MEYGEIKIRIEGMEFNKVERYRVILHKLILSGGWLNNQFYVMVATNAFGMGIDKPDVRFVLHYEFPPSLEAYFQEAGRAGRDGNQSRTIVFYQDNDVEELIKRNSM